MPRIPQRVPTIEAAEVARRRETGRGSVLALQRSIGNQAVAQLLQRQPTRTEMLSKAAKDLGAASMVYDVAAGGVEENDIGYARRIDVGKSSIKPGLNIVENLGARGRTGFVAADGTYLGDTLPAITPELPRIAICIGKQAFDEGENMVRSTLRHELEHAMHDQLLILVQRDWRESLRKGGKALPKSEADAEKQFFAFAATDKVNSIHGRPSAADMALIRGATRGRTTETELLAYLAGFMAIFETTPPVGPKAILGASMAPALEQLRGAAHHGWAGVDEKIKALAKARIRDFDKSLPADKKQLLRDWLEFLRLQVTTSTNGGSGEEAEMIRYVRSSDVFGQAGEFLGWMLEAIGENKAARPAQAVHQR